MVSRKACLSGTFSVMWAMTLSDSLSPSSIDPIELRTSWGTLRDSLTYCSNCEKTLRIRASALRSRLASAGSAAPTAMRLCGVSSTRSMANRVEPSTRILTVPSGSLRSCRISAMVPRR